MAQQNPNVGRTAMAKKLVIEEYKRRLRDNIRSLNDNFVQILQATKISTDDNMHKVQSGRMTEYYTTKDEMSARAALMVRACDELHRLTNDLKEFLILHDFNYLSSAIQNAEGECDKNIEQQKQIHQNLKIEIANLISDIDRELTEHFQLRH
ncbi:hypothetical protein WR25_14305 [Diploscapter pachys]|uniref:Mediator of RNA polymerase II transcription subunit 22 n=1 Tax=Diploscapter pachys TaxID=2018661 RepID=A0A2A2KGV2_9BILA|nr:hypothetical protein WR25_14305 [Diploscapter pachys]